MKPLAEAAERDRAAMAPRGGGAGAPAPAKAVVPFVAVVDEEQVRAAVTVALDASMAAMAEEIGRRVMAALATRKPEVEPPPAPVAAPAAAEPLVAAAPVPPPPPEAPAPIAPRVEPVRRVSSLRNRSGSILGLEISRPEPEDSFRDSE